MEQENVDKKAYVQAVYDRRHSERMTAFDEKSARYRPITNKAGKVGCIGYVGLLATGALNVVGLIAQNDDLRNISGTVFTVAFPMAIAGTEISYRLKGRLEDDLEFAKKEERWDREELGLDDSDPEW